MTEGWPVPQLAVAGITGPRAATPMISARIPTRTIVTGGDPVAERPGETAGRERAEGEQSTNPVCSASYPSTFCSHSGRDRMMPDAPSDEAGAITSTQTRRHRMGFYFRKRVRLNKSAHVNLSKSGASISEKVGPVTVNSRGRVTVRILPGLTWRIGKRR
ncbi:MAG: DUF4236 domain-containing protein [Lacisediminihabitans sp.]